MRRGANEIFARGWPKPVEKQFQTKLRRKWPLKLVEDYNCTPAFTLLIDKNRKKTFLGCI